MNLEIYEKRPTEKTVNFSLQRGGDGRLHVVAVDDVGDIEAYLVTFKPNGKLFIQSGVDEHLGFQLDERGRILEDENCYCD